MPPHAVYQSPGLQIYRNAREEHPLNTDPEFLGEHMRYLRQVCCTLVMVCLLATVAFADDGIMHPDDPADTALVELTVTLIQDATGWL